MSRGIEYGRQAMCLIGAVVFAAAGCWIAAAEEAQFSKEIPAYVLDRELGAKKPMLTSAETSLLITSVQKCWNPPPGAVGQVSVHFQLNRFGEVIGTPKTITAVEGKEPDEIAFAAAKRAVLKCQPYELPADKYDAWNEVIVNFVTD